MICLTGTGSVKEKKAALQRLQEVADDEPLVIVATGKYVGEGFDYPRLDTLFLVSPISWKGRLQQYAGRLHREFDGKNDVRIYDYIDIHEPMCDNMYHKRLKGYASIGYITVSLNAPTLFYSADDLDSDPVESLIFNGKSFCKPFVFDIASVRKSIIISSPRLYNVSRNPLVSHLRELAASGVEVIVFTKSENEQSVYLKQQGLTVHVVGGLNLCCAIIDKSSVWYGSINVLGYSTEEDNVIKLDDSKLAGELINELFK